MLQNDTPHTADSQTVAVVTCAVLDDEINHFIQGLPHIVHLEIMEQGLHNEPDKLRTELQLAINRVEQDHAPHTIVLGYGICSRGIEGVTSTTCKLVVARAHDCITLLLGSKETYANYVKQFPGTYWYSPGWNKHHTPPGKDRYDILYAQYLEKYGEDNAQYLMEAEQHWFTTYSRATYVDLTIGVTDEDLQYTRDCAQWLKWDYDHQQGDPALLKDLLSGPWDDERFLVVNPGQTIAFTADEYIIKAVPANNKSLDSTKD